MSIETLREEWQRTKLCPKCLNVGTINVQPHQLGWLRRRDLEEEMKVPTHTRIWETPTGMLQPVNKDPVALRAPCPVCNPRNPPGMSILLGHH